VAVPTISEIWNVPKGSVFFMTVLARGQMRRMAPEPRRMNIEYATHRVRSFGCFRQAILLSLPRSPT
jgi:hypothetical protein